MALFKFIADMQTLARNQNRHSDEKQIHDFLNQFDDFKKEISSRKYKN